MSIFRKGILFENDFSWRTRPARTGYRRLKFSLCSFRCPGAEKADGYICVGKAAMVTRKYGAISRTKLKGGERSGFLEMLKMQNQVYQNPMMDGNRAIKNILAYCASIPFEACVGVEQGWG